MDNFMRYKGYFAKVHYSEQDNCFWGKIEGIRYSITFEGTTVSELRKDFEEAIDDYIELCKQDGVEPQKQYSGSFNIRITPELHRDATILSKIRDISLNQLVERALAKEVKLGLNK